ncbi:MAG TPA: sulfate ABC transporter permease subunit CysT [Limnochorda sp.]
MLRARPRLFPGFGLTLGFTTLYMSLLVLLPLAALVARASGLGWDGLVQVLRDPRVWASLRLSFGASLIAAGVNGIFGLLLAWCLARYRFPGRRLVDAAVDLPFALPTAVSGIALTAVYAPTGWIGRFLDPLGIRVAFTPLGVILALVFVGLPFVVRAVEPALRDLGKEMEEAAESLGAGRWQTFVRVILPAVGPAVMTGSILAFARALGEYGSIVFISGNLPMRTEIAPVLIMAKLEQFDYAGAAAMAVVMLACSLFMLLAVRTLERRLAGPQAREE